MFSKYFDPTKYLEYHIWILLNMNSLNLICPILSVPRFSLAWWSHSGVDCTPREMWTKARISQPASLFPKHILPLSWPPVIHPPLKEQVKWRRAFSAHFAWRTFSHSTNSKPTLKRSTLGMTAMWGDRSKVSPIDCYWRFCSLPWSHLSLIKLCKTGS